MAGDTKAPERYELEELFPEEAPETLHFLKVGGGVVVVLLIVLALGYSLLWVDWGTGEAAEETAASATE